MLCITIISKLDLFDVFLDTNKYSDNGCYGNRYTKDNNMYYFFYVINNLR